VEAETGRRLDGAWRAHAPVRSGAECESAAIVRFTRRCGKLITGGVEEALRRAEEGRDQ
jgi:hypothetical protein